MLRPLSGAHMLSRLIPNSITEHAIADPLPLFLHHSLTLSSNVVADVPNCGLYLMPSELSYAFAFLLGTFLECVMYGEHLAVCISTSISALILDSLHRYFFCPLPRRMLCPVGQVFTAAGGQPSCGLHHSVLLVDHHHGKRGRGSPPKSAQEVDAVAHPNS